MHTMFGFHQRLVGTALAALMLTGALTMLSACNTTAGLGQDVSNAGHAVTNSAEKVKQGM
jgi:predicted small secreted protein